MTDATHQDDDGNPTFPGHREQARDTGGLLDLIAEGIEAFRLTREYVGEDTLPAIEGWSWFDWCEKARAILAQGAAHEERCGDCGKPWDDVHHALGHPHHHPFSQGAAHEEHPLIVKDGIGTCQSCGAVGVVGAAHEERGLDVERLAKGIQAGLTLRLIAGNTDQTYTPNEVATMVASVIEEQLARFGTPEAAPEDPRSINETPEDYR